MSDAQTDDARPLTKDERDMLASCLFRLYSAIYFVEEIQSSVLHALEDEKGVRIDTVRQRRSYDGDMREAIDLIDKLSKSFGVQVDG